MAAGMLPQRSGQLAAPAAQPAALIDGLLAALSGLPPSQQAVAWQRLLGLAQAHQGPTQQEHSQQPCAAQQGTTPAHGFMFAELARRCQQHGVYPSDNRSLQGAAVASQPSSVVDVTQTGEDDLDAWAARGAARTGAGGELAGVARGRGRGCVDSRRGRRRGGRQGRGRGRGRTSAPLLTDDEDAEGEAGGCLTCNYYVKESIALVEEAKRVEALKFGGSLQDLHMSNADFWQDVLDGMLRRQWDGKQQGRRRSWSSLHDRWKTMRGDYRVLRDNNLMSPSGREDYSP